ncbi:MAG TPA: TIGR01777 family oxidoreductase, partial [Acidobacteriaceae bacterium]|nr:TIGR01777 family oxidoreductase [Acidobacteriaceae bacterium]
LPHKPAVLVSASAIGYYGNRGDEILTEQSKPGAGFLADLCVHWEQEARKAQEFGLRVVTIRIATVLGREGGALPKMLTPFKLGLGGKFGSGRQWMPWVHIDDLVSLFLFATRNDAIAGALNGGSPQPVMNAEFTKVLGGVLRRPAPWTVPRFALKLALGEMSDVLFDSQRVMPTATEQTGFRFEYPGLKPALENLLR